MKRSSILLLGTVLGCWLVGGGCATTEPTRFYVLASPQVTSSRAGDSNCPVLGIGPVEIPAYLDRPQIVVRLSPNEIQPSDFDQWGEPLVQGISRVIADAISKEICVQRVEYYPWKSSMSVDYQVTLRIRSFEGKPGEKAQLVADWRLYGPDSRRPLREGTIEYSEPVPLGHHEHMVAAQSRLIQKAGSRIGQEIQKLSR